MSKAAAARHNDVLSLEEIGELAKQGGKPAETLMKLVGLIANRFRKEAFVIFCPETKHKQAC